MSRTNSTIHYAVEYGADGLPTRLSWSPEIQAAKEESMRQYRARITEQYRNSRKPMESYLEWARARGLWD